MNEFPTAKLDTTAGTINLRDYLQPVLANKLLIIALVAAATVGTYIFYSNKPPIYQSSTAIFVGPAASVAGLDPAAPTSVNAVANQARLLQTQAVARRVARRIGYKGPPGALLGGLNVAGAPGSDFLTVSVTSSSPQTAALLADSFAQAFIELRANERRDAAAKGLAALEKNLAETVGGTSSARALRLSLEARISQLRLAMSVPAGNATQVDKAFIPGSPLSPHPKRSAIFAFALSLLLGVIVAFGLERIDRRLKSDEDAETLYALPVIGTVRQDRRVVASFDGLAGVAETLRESFRSLRSNLDLAARVTPLRTILVTSAVPEEGKSIVVRNLGLVYAEAGLRVVIVEADLRRPSLARSFGVQPAPGLSDLLTGAAELEDIQQTIPIRASESGAAQQPPKVVSGSGSGHHPVSSMHAVTELNRGVHHGRLTYIPSGPRPSDPPALFAGAALIGLLRRLATEHDVVLIDSPPILAVSDAVPLLTIVDGTVMVCRLGTTTTVAARRAVTMLQRIPNTRVLGLVVNGTDGDDFVERYEGY